jgi:hypothetical protein
MCLDFKVSVHVGSTGVALAWVRWQVVVLVVFNTAGTLMHFHSTTLVIFSVGGLLLRVAFSGVLPVYNMFHFITAV